MAGDHVELSRAGRMLIAWAVVIAAFIALALLFMVPSKYGFSSEIRILPDPALTPGEIASTDEAEVCGRVDGETYERRTRAALTEKLKREITVSYGQVPHQDGDHELDHRVPAALGGASTKRNVWWQPGRGHGTPWTFQIKDRLDTMAWRMVCVKHTMPLTAAQGLFLQADWRLPYCQLIGGDICKTGF